eukprot:3642107-Pleurochrysis_carterae.AAC.1
MRALFPHGVQRVVCAHAICPPRSPALPPAQWRRRGLGPRGRILDGHDMDECPLMPITNSRRLHPLHRGPREVSGGIKWSLRGVAHLTGAQQ